MGRRARALGPDAPPRRHGGAAGPEPVVRAAPDRPGRRLGTRCAVTADAVDGPTGSHPAAGPVQKGIHGKNRRADPTPDRRTHRRAARPGPRPRRDGGGRRPRPPASGPGDLRAARHPQAGPRPAATVVPLVRLPARRRRHEHGRRRRCRRGVPLLSRGAGRVAAPTTRGGPGERAGRGAAGR